MDHTNSNAGFGTVRSMLRWDDCLALIHSLDGGKGGFEPPYTRSLVSLIVTVPLLILIARYFLGKSNTTLRMPIGGVDMRGKNLKPIIGKSNDLDEDFILLLKDSITRYYRAILENTQSPGLMEFNRGLILNNLYQDIGKCNRDLLSSIGNDRRVLLELTKDKNTLIYKLKYHGNFENDVDLFKHHVDGFESVLDLVRSDDNRDTFVRFLRISHGRLESVRSSREEDSKVPDITYPKDTTGGENNTVPDLPIGTEDTDTNPSTRIQGVQNDDYTSENQIELD